MGESKAITDVEQGDYIMLNSCPCQVVEINDSQGTQYQVEGTDVIDGKDYQETFSSDDTVETVDVEYEEVEVESVSHGDLTVKFKDGTEVTARDDTVITQLYQEIVACEDRGEEVKVMAKIVSAAGRRAVLWA